VLAAGRSLERRAPPANKCSFMMARTILVTGSSGFVGRTLRTCLADAPWRVLGMTRSARAADADLVFGDLLAPEIYRNALKGVDAIVHLAALTGKASTRDYWRVNVEGTRALLAACKEAGVGHILYVSTIAAGYSDRRHYAYAESKLAAEALVRDSGLAFTILRPTIVLGADSPIWATLCRIVRLPIIPLPQGARAVHVQPVDVRDVARAIKIVLTDWHFQGETLDIGGADPESITDFLKAVRRATIGTSAPIIRAPLAPIRWLLALVEPVARPLLPVTAGQLALFANDSVAHPNWLFERLRPRMPTLGAMLADLVGPKAAAVALPPPGPDDVVKLETECGVFARYLTGTAPSGDAVRHYVGAAQAHGLSCDAALSDFDRLTLSLARRSPWWAHCVDAFCALLHRRGALRRKIIVFAAVIENQPPTNEIFEKPQSPGPIGAFLQLVVCGLASVVAFLSGAVGLCAARIARLGRT
jgi:nucleoside-diphosphate-sugar epimerase